MSYKNFVEFRERGIIQSNLSYGINDKPFAGFVITINTKYRIRSIINELRYPITDLLQEITKVSDSTTLTRQIQKSIYSFTYHVHDPYSKEEIEDTHKARMLSIDSSKTGNGDLKHLKMDTISNQT